MAIIKNLILGLVFLTSGLIFIFERDFPYLLIALIAIACIGDAKGGNSE